jgi:hypothetical protein
VLYDMSYTNLMLYSASLPSYNSSKQKGKVKGSYELINGDDPTRQAEINKLFDETNRRR